MICVQGIPAKLAAARTSSGSNTAGASTTITSSAFTASTSTAFVGVSAMLVACVCSSFAGVYFEMMLKSSQACKPVRPCPRPSPTLRYKPLNPPRLLPSPAHTSLHDNSLLARSLLLAPCSLIAPSSLPLRTALWLRNIQLGVWATSIALATVCAQHDPLVATHGRLHGFGAGQQQPMVRSHMHCPPLLTPRARASLGLSLHPASLHVQSPGRWWVPTRSEGCWSRSRSNTRTTSFAALLRRSLSSWVHSARNISSHSYRARVSNASSSQPLPLSLLLSASSSPSLPSTPGVHTGFSLRRGVCHRCDLRVRWTLRRPVRGRR